MESEKEQYAAAAAAAAENKNYEDLEIDDGNPQEFDVQRKIYIASAPFEKFQFLIVVTLLIILLLGNVILLAVSSATFNQTPSCSDSTEATTSGLRDSQYSEIARLMTSIEDKINNSQAYNTDQFSQLSKALQDLSDAVDIQMAYTANNSDALGDLTNFTTQRLISILGSLTTIETNGITTAGTANDILVGVKQVLALQNASLLLNTFQHLSCSDLLNAQPNSTSGYYHINSQTVYCNMDNLCGAGGGWTRIGYLNMADGTASCPTGFKYYETGGVRACGRQSNAPGCTTTSFQPNFLSYSKVCGKVTGYQFGSTDGFLGGPSTIDSHYVEGISITYGSPRTHIWTLASGLRQNNIDGGHYNCPCSTGSIQTVPSFVGNNYYCESGNPHLGIFNQLWVDDPLWDGQGCSALEQGCCTATNLPYFYRDFGNTSISDGIEFRICGDQGDLEDTPVSLIELYVK